MPLESEEKRIARLNRIRNNQRRCRARKQEHFSELEHRIREQDLACSQICEEHRKSMQQLQEENERLRELLGVVGVHSICIDAFVKGRSTAMIAAPFDGLENPQMAIPEGDLLLDELSSNKTAVPNSSGPFAEELAIQALETTAENALDDRSRPLSLEAGIGSGQSLLPFATSNENSSFLLEAASWDMPQDLATDNPATNFPVLSLPAEPQIPNWPSMPSCCRDLPDGTTEETTLCSIAFDLLRQFNTRGADLLDVGIRLWRGFRKESTMGEGCRVNTRLLFEVLNEMKGVSS